MRRQSRGPKSTCASGGDTTTRGRKVRGKGHISFPAGCGRRGGIPAQGPGEGARSLCPQSPSGPSSSPRCAHRAPGFKIPSVFPKLPGQESNPILLPNPLTLDVSSQLPASLNRVLCRFWLPNDSSLSERGRNYDYFCMGWMVKP